MCRPVNSRQLQCSNPCRGWTAAVYYYWSPLGKDYRMPDKSPPRGRQGFLLDIPLGIAGAVVGGWPYQFFGAGGVTGLNLYSLLVAVIGSAVVLVVTGRRRTTRGVLQWTTRRDHARTRHRGRPQDTRTAFYSRLELSADRAGDESECAHCRAKDDRGG